MDGGGHLESMRESQPIELTFYLLCFLQRKTKIRSKNQVQETLKGVVLENGRLERVTGTNGIDSCNILRPMRIVEP